MSFLRGIGQEGWPGGGAAAPLLICTPNFRGDGGIAAYVRTLVDALAPEPVDILDFNQGRTLHPVPPNARIVGQASSAPEFAARLAVEWMRRPPGHVLFGHFGLARPLALLPRRHYTTVLAHGMEVWGPLPKGRAQGLSRIDQMVFTTVFSRDQFSQWNRDLATSSLSMPVIPLTAGPAWETRPLAPRPVRSRRRVLCISRLIAREPLKGIGTLLAASKHLPEHYEVLFAGDGDGRLAYEREATQLGLEGRVRFLGWVPEGDKAALLDDADLMALPSAQEGFGLVYLEALSAGRPCVGACAGAVPEVLGRDFAELAPYADAEGTAEAIVRVVERQERGELSAEQLRRDYVARYGWDRFRERWADLLHGVTAARRSA